MSSRDLQATIVAMIAGSLVGFMLAYGDASPLVLFYACFIVGLLIGAIDKS